MSESDAEILRDVRQRLTLSGAQRSAPWEEAGTLTEAIAKPGFLEENAATLAGLVLEANTRIFDPTLKRGVERVLKRSLANTTFFKTFAGAVVKYGSQPRGKQTSYGLLKWTSALLTRLTLPESQKAISKLLPVAARCLDELDTKSSRRVEQSLAKWIASEAAVRQEVWSIVKETHSAGLLKLLIDAVAPLKGDPLRPELLSHYCTTLLATKTPPSMTHLTAYHALLGSLTREEFGEVVQPALTRALRRTPELVLDVSASLFRAVNLDMSLFGVELQKALLPLVRQSTPAIQEAALDVLTCVAKLISDRDILQEMLKAVEESLSGKAEGKVKNVNERLSLVKAISTLAHSPSKKPDLSTQTSEYLASLLEQEGNEEGKAVVMASQGMWLRGCEALSEVVLKGLNGALNGKEALRNATLDALTSCHDQANLFSTGKVLVPALCKIVETALAKPAQRSEGISALLVLSLISVGDPESDDLVEKAGIWEKSLSSGSPFLDPSLFLKLSAKSCEVVTLLCEQLLLHHVSRVDCTPGRVEMICEALVLLSLHGTKSIRSAAFMAIRRCLGGSSTLMPNFLSALLHWLQLPSDAAQVMTQADGDSRVAQSEIKHRYLEALKHLIPYGVDANGTVLAKLLIITHHPILQSPKDPSSTWKALSKLHTEISSSLERVLDEVVDVIVSEAGLTNADAGIQSAALAVVSTCAERFPEALFSQLLPFLHSHLDKSEADDVTDQDLTIFRTPEGKLSTEVEESVVIVSDTKKKQKKKKPKGRYRHEKVAFAEQSESSEEEEEEPPLPKSRPTEASKGVSKGKRPGHMDAAERQMAFREKQLSEEAEIRQKVAQIERKLAVGLQTLRAVIQGNVRFAANHIETLSDFVLPLLTSPLVGEGAAFEAVDALAVALPPPLNLIPLDVAIVLRLVLEYEKTGSIPYDEILQHASTLAVMHALAALQIQGGGQFFLLLPILRMALQSTQSPFFDDALTVLTQHCAPGEHLPRTETFALLFHVLCKSPTSKSPIQITLVGMAVYRGVVLEALKNLCIDLIGDEVFSLLDGLLFSNPVVRSVAIEALFMVPSLLTGLSRDGDRISALLLLACHDSDSENATRAQELFQASGASITEGQMDTLTPLMGHEAGDIRQAAVGALGQYLQTHPIKTQSLLTTVIQTLQGDCGKEWFIGGALLLEQCGKLFASGQTKLALDFLLSHGLTHSDDAIREKMVAAGLALVDSYDPRDTGALFELLDQKLAEAKGANRNTTADDRMREGAVVLLGSLAKHLSPDDPKLKDIISNLLDVLSTPSEAVQRAASICLSPLMSKCQSDGDYTTEIVTQLKKQVAEGESYGHRRGAAYGIAGVVKGCGISALKNYGIMDSLIQYVEDKSRAAAREGGISAFDCLSQRLGKLFEPYVIHILPLLLTCFGDASLAVRQVTSDASRTIMHNLSAQGVKLVLPSLMKGLEDKAWRTKQGSIQLLGAMAWCAPKQLSTCLPMIVPKLITVLADPHPKVHTAAEYALEEVGSTIRNPEVQQFVPDILSAIAYPAQNTVSCLDKLLESRFQNTIDAPSLALIVPVVHHGLKDRTGENKKRAARIVQNLCKLVNDPKDMDPYIDILLPELKKGIVDTLPDVRAQTSKALSSLMYDMGKQALDEVMPWLLETLESKSSAVERSGAAQAISEALAVFGEDYFETLLPKIFENCASPNPLLREGGIAVLRFLPFSMPETFEKILDRSLPYILDGLADENESVRDISLAAGRTLVDVYAQSSLPVILPAVEQSLFHANWRIRQSSVELLGNLIFKVAGTTGKIKLDGGSDDEGPATQSYGRNLVTALGLERRNSVLAKLYMSRSDVQHPVRTAALHIWKTVVVNTPKTLMEMLAALMDLIVEMLAFGEEDGRQTSARCLGELVRKMGDRFLPKIIPIMEQCFSSENADTREGVCYGLSELLDSLNSTQMAEYLPVLLPTIQSTLCDESPAVREAAAAAFDAVFKAGASSVVESVIPDLLHKLESDKQGAQALEGLRVILSIRPHTFENMIPKLLKEPLSAKRLTAFASMAEVAPGALRNHLVMLMKILMRQGSQREATPITEAAREAADTVVRVIPEEHLTALVNELKKGLEDSSMRLSSAMLMATLASARPVGDHVESLFQALVPLMSEEDPETLQECWKALKAVAATVPKEMRPTYVRVLSEAVETAREKERRKDPSRDVILVPGFCLAEGIAPILPFYIEGVQSASGELRESSATGLGELISVMDADASKPFVGLIMGPLIRIINDRFPWQIKLAILKTMGLLIFKAGDEMRKFVAALQPIFLKCLPDPTEAIRDSAAKNLGHLTRLSPRIDPLITNLGNFAMKTEPPMRNAYLSALSEALIVSGEKISPAILQKTGTLLMDLLSSVGLFVDDTEENVIALGVTLGCFCKYCEMEYLKALLKKRLEDRPALWTQRLLNGVFMATIARHSANRLHEADLFPLFTESYTRFVRDDSVPVKKAGCRVAARLLMSESKQSALASAVPVLAACLSPDQTTEIQEEAVKSVQLVCSADAALLKPYLKELVPLLCALAREASGARKTACETALSLILELSDGFITAQGYLNDSPGAAAKSLLVEPYLRRIQRLTRVSEYENERY